MLVADAALDMTKPEERLPVTCPKLLRVTLVAQTWYRIGKTIHALYLNIDKLVANEEIIFLKPSARIVFHKNKLSDTPLLKFQYLHVGEPGWIPISIMQNFEIFSSVVK